MQRFEVASIKKAAEGVRAEALVRLGSGCDGGFPRVEHNRFVVTTTLYALTTWAWGLNKYNGCSYASFAGLVSGGPEWVRSDRFELQALMPASSPDYTTAQFLAGEAPGLELMIRSLLVERFGLAVRVGTKDVPLFELVAAKRGPKLSLADANDPPRLLRRTEPNGLAHIVGKRISMSSLCLMLMIEAQRPVLDATGLAGDFDFDLEFAPQNSPDSAGPSLFTALQEQMGLRLESKKGPVQAIVIEAVEKPSEN